MSKFTPAGRRGFTIIELVIAIFLLTVGTGAAVAVIQSTTGFSAVASSQLTASYLAQEGIEIIRNQRDSNWLAQTGNPGLAWDNGISAANDYRLDYKSRAFPDVGCSLGAGNFLKYDGSFYNCSTGAETRFKRKITVTKPQADEMIVSVEVAWSERGRDHLVVAQTKLKNWK